MSSSSDVKKCCKDSKSNKNTPNNCDGKCKNACSSSSVHIAFITFTHTELSTPVFSFYAKKEKIYTTESFVSSNFYAIWLPPKIG